MEKNFNNNETSTESLPKKSNLWKKLTLWILGFVAVATAGFFAFQQYFLGAGEIPINGISEQFFSVYYYAYDQSESAPSGNIDSGIEPVSTAIPETKANITKFRIYVFPKNSNDISRLKYKINDDSQTSINITTQNSTNTCSYNNADGYYFDYSVPQSGTAQITFSPLYSVTVTKPSNKFDVSYSVNGSTTFTPLSESNVINVSENDTLKLQLPTTSSQTYAVKKTADNTESYISPETGDKYNIGKITSDITIDIVAKYKVTFATENLFEMADISYAESNDGISFPDEEQATKLNSSNNPLYITPNNYMKVFVKPKTRYDQSKIEFKTVIPDSPGIVIEPNDDKSYSWQVTNDTNVNIEGLELNKYDLTFKSGMDSVDWNALKGRINIKINETTYDVCPDSLTCTHGDKISFTITPQPGYTFGSGNIVTIEGTGTEPKTYKAQDSSVQIPDFEIIGDTTITISDVILQSYYIKFVDENEKPLGNENGITDNRLESINVNGVAITNFVDSKTITCDQNKVELTPKNAYNKSKIQLQIGNDEPISSPTQGNTFNISVNDTLSTDDTSPTLIKVIGFELNKYNLSITKPVSSDDKAFEVKYYGYNGNNKQETAGTPYNYDDEKSPTKNFIPHGNTFTFTFETSEGYTAIDDTVENFIDFSGSTITPENVTLTCNDNIATFTISDVTGDLTINLKDNFGPQKCSAQLLFEDLVIPEKNKIKVYKLQKDPSTSKYSAVPCDLSDKGVVNLKDISLLDRDESAICIAWDKTCFNQKENPTFTIDPNIKLCDMDDPQAVPKDWGEANTGIICKKITFPEENRYAIQNFSITTDCLAPQSRTINVNLHNTALASNEVSYNYGNTNKTSSFETSETQKTATIPYGSSGVQFTITAKTGYEFGDVSDSVQISEGNANNWTINNNVGLENSIKMSSGTILGNSTININCNVNNIPIDFKSIKGLKYYKINIEQEEQKETTTITDATLGDELHGIITTMKDIEYYFAVKADSGYDPDTLKLSLGTGTDLTKITDEANPVYTHFYNDTKVEDINKYTIYKIPGGNVKTAVTVTGSIEKIKLNVTLKKEADVDGVDEKATISYFQDKYPISNNLTVLYGDSVSFQVQLEEKYNQSKFKVVVYDSDSPETSETQIVEYQGSYIVNDITSNKTVEIKDVSINSYVLNFVYNDAAQFVINGKAFSGTKSIPYNSNFEFEVKAKEGYKLDDNLVVNCQKVSGDKALSKNESGNTAEGGKIYKFKLNNITEDCTLIIGNVESIKYKVILEKVDGATYLNDQGAVISGTLNIKYGKNFEFGINVDDSYDDSKSGMYIIVNNGQSNGLSAQKLASGKYIIPNVTQDIRIKVGNIRKNTYTVTLTKTEGIDYYNFDNRVITGDNKVEHKGSISFKVSLYPAYSNSSAKVMLGNDALTPDSSGYYTISNIDENKTVTVIGIEQNVEANLVNTINNLPTSIDSLDDVNSIIEATKIYNSLSEDQKSKVSNLDALQNLQEQSKSKLHSNNDITIDGVDWYVKLVAVPISSDVSACARIYNKLNSEYILSLYDIYLWNTLTDTRYNLPEGESVVVTVPAPDLTYFERPTGIHEQSSDGKISYMTLNFNGNKVSFETSSFSAMGIIANRSSTPGRSSLLDAMDANVQMIKDYALGTSNSKSSDGGNSGNTVFNDDSDDDNIGNTEEGNINDKFKSKNNIVTAQGSALRLILILFILLLIGLSLWIIYKKRKEKKEKTGK